MTRAICRTCFFCQTISASLTIFAVTIGMAACAGSSSVTSTPPPSTTTPTPPAPPTPSAAQPKFAYTANELTANLSGYSVDPTTGALTPLAGFPIASGTNPIFITHDPANKFAIVADIASDKINVYAINATTGMLTPVPPFAYATGREPRSITIDPTGQFVYVTNSYTDNISAFALSPAGVLTPIPGSPFAIGGSLNGTNACCVITDPSGKFLYLQDRTNVYAYTINPATGVLTLVNALAIPSFAKAIGNGLAVDPTGAYLYSVASGPALFQTLTINPTTGAIALGPTSPMAFPNGSYTISLDPTGRFAYTVENSQYLVAYSVLNGVMTSLKSSSPAALGSSQLAIDPSGSFVYALQTSTLNNVTGFRISSTGTLSALPSSPTPSGGWPYSMTITSQ
jgi:6-phosphogluconolactonase